MKPGEIFHNFKSWCKRNGIYCSKYYLKKHLMEGGKYHGTDYSFSIVMEED